MSGAHPRNPRSEAAEILGDGRVGLVLEPSPPAVNQGPWFADAPANPAGLETAVLVSPVVTGDQSWEAAIVGDDRAAAFARDHWLANLKSLDEPPTTLAETRSSLTALAFHVLSPARQQANGRIGLRWTKGGFGTPFFGDDRQVRVEGELLVVQDGDSVAVQPVTTLRAAGRFVGVTPAAPAGIEFHDPPPAIDVDEVLVVDPAAVAFLDDWFGYSTLVLERLLVLAGSPHDTRVQLWPEHFDPAIELGDAALGSRASFGASPGDPAMGVPYLYVSPWSTQEGEFWTAPFGGAALTLDELRTAPDPVAAALSFFERARALLG